MRTFQILTALIFAYLIYGLYLARYDVRILPEELKAKPPHGFFELPRRDQRAHALKFGQRRPIRDHRGGASGRPRFHFDHGLEFIRWVTKPAGYHGPLLVMVDGQYSYLNSRMLHLGRARPAAVDHPRPRAGHLGDWLSQDRRDPESGLLF